MKWNIKQNKNGTKCVITCDKNVKFIKANIIFNTYDIDNDVKAKEVTLLVPFNSWRKENNESRYIFNLGEFEMEKTKYNELLCSVTRKFEGETRHETALRYINEAENKCDGECSCKPDKNVVVPRY